MNTNRAAIIGGSVSRIRMKFNTVSFKDIHTPKGKQCETIRPR